MNEYDFWRYSSRDDSLYYNYYHLFGKIGWISALGNSLIFAAIMFEQRLKKKFFFQFLAIGILFIYYFFIIPENLHDWDEVTAIILVVSFISAHLLVAFLPFILNYKENTFWNYNASLFEQTVLTVIFGGVLLGGLELAIVSIDKLFSLDFDEKIFLYTAIFILIFGSMVIFLLFKERGFEKLIEDKKYPIVLKFFTQFILIPLLIIYCVILYLYAGKILLNWDLPRGWVSYLVMGYSLVGILAILLVYPLKETTGASWVKFFSKAFYFTLIPLLILLFFAILTRINEYGFTEKRYLLFGIGIWLSVITVYFILFRNSKIIFIPASLFVFAVFSIGMPFANCFSVSKISQQNGVQKLLEENNLLNNNKIDFTIEIKDSVLDLISDKIKYLHKRDNFDYILEKIDHNKLDSIQKIRLSQTSSYQAAFEFIDMFTNVVEQQNNKNNYDHQYYSINYGYDTLSLMPIESFRYVLNLNQIYYRYKKFNIKVDDYFLVISQKKYGKVEERHFTFKLYDKDNILLDNYDLYPEIKKYFDENHNGLNQQTMNEPIAFEFKLRELEFQISFSSISKTLRKNKADNYDYSEDLLLIK